jgi:hypothetical protein
MAEGNELSMIEFMQTIGGTTVATNRPIKQILPSNQRKRYSLNDLESLISRTHIKRDAGRNNVNFVNQTPRGLIQYFQPIHENIGEIIRNSERFKELGPEISEAAEILVSCILSPNDLQEGNPSFSIDGAHYFDPETYDKIIKFLEEYFNDDYRLGRKLKGWIHEALFRSGAKVLLTLPERSLNSLFKTDYDKKRMSGSETMRKYNKSIAQSQSDQWLKLAKDRPISGGATGTESLNYKEVLHKFKLESDTLVRRLNLEKIDNDIKTAVESFTIKFAAELEDGDMLHISENPGILKFGKHQKKDAHKNAVKAVYGSMMEEGQAQEYEPFISLLNHFSTEESSQNHPLVMDIPTEACIPVCIPGSKEEKLGYFILIDEYGYPLEAHKYLCDQGCDCNNNAAAAAFSAMYGQNSKYGKVTEKLVYAGSLGGDATFDPQKSAMAGIFDYVLDTMLHHRLKNMGLGHVDVAKFGTIAACMLRRFLEKKRTCLVFVPADFITYLAYDYRNDGTGLSKLESIKILLSIRATLMVAGMMSATNAAIPHKRIDVTLDEQDASFEQTLQTVLEMATLKANGGLQLGYTDIMTSIIDSHLSIVPKNMAGIQGMELEKSETQNSPNRVDDNLMDFLNKMIVTALEVPPAALNQTSEAEYSRSVATTNIYFSNKVANKQNITCDHVSRHCQVMLKNDPILLEGLRQIISGKTQVDVDAADIKKEQQKEEKIKNINLEDGIIHMEKEEDDLFRKLIYIIENLRIILPSPNVAADKSQYEEAQAVMNLINQYLDNIYNRDLFSKDSDIGDAFSVMLSSLKMVIFKDVTKNLGMIGSFDLPTIEDIAQSADEVMRTYRVVRNFSAMLDQDKTLQTREPTLSEGDGSGDDTSSSSGDTDFSSDDSGDSGGDWGGF